VILHEGDCPTARVETADQTARGHEETVLLLLGAIVAYLTRGRGNASVLAREMQASSKGARLGQWMLKHEDALKKRTDLPQSEPRKGALDFGELQPTNQSNRDGLDSSLNEAKKLNDGDTETLAKANRGRSPYSELNGAIGEARGWSQAIESGHLPIAGPGKASLPGPDYITYDPSSRSIIVWDAKYRAPNSSYPASLPHSKLHAWQAKIIDSIKNMPEGKAKAAAESALKSGRVEGRILKWLQ